VLTLLVGRQKEHAACMQLQRGANDLHGPADATATPLSLALLKSTVVLPFWCRLTQVVLEKGR